MAAAAEQQQEEAEVAAVSASNDGDDDDDDDTERRPTEQQEEVAAASSPAPAAAPTPTKSRDGSSPGGGGGGGGTRRPTASGRATPRRSNRQDDRDNRQQERRKSKRRRKKKDDGQTAERLQQKQQTTSTTTKKKRQKERQGQEKRQDQDQDQQQDQQQQQHPAAPRRKARPISIYPDASVQSTRLVLNDEEREDGKTPSAAPSTKPFKTTLVPSLLLPHNQYETVLRRRAVVKVDDAARAAKEAGQRKRKQQSAMGWGRPARGEATAEQKQRGADAKAEGGGAPNLRPTIEEARRLHLPGMPSLRFLPAQVDAVTRAVTDEEVRTSVGEAQEAHLPGMPSPLPQNLAKHLVGDGTNNKDDDADGTTTTKGEEEEEGRVRFASIPGSSSTVATTNGGGTGSPTETAPLPTAAADRPHEEEEEEEEEEHDDDLIGDTSLGMKLTILEGKVLVQNLNSLADGRASPAQLTGLIERGDVLVAIDGRSLVHLEMDKLVEGLKPLSSAEPASLAAVGVGEGEAQSGGGGGSSSLLPPGVPVYRRELRLRFAIGEGLPYLDRRARRRTAAAAAGGATGGGGVVPPEVDVFGLGQFYMVDQLSGMPLFGEGHDGGGKGGGGGGGAAKAAETAPVADAKEKKDITSEAVQSTAIVPTASSTRMSSSAVEGLVFGLSATGAARLYREIASQVSAQRQWERMLANSEFFALDERRSRLLRSSSESSVRAKTVAGVLGTTDDDGHGRRNVMTMGELMARGEKSMEVAKILLDGVEEADRAGGGEEHTPRTRRRRRSAEDVESDEEDENSDDDASSRYSDEDADDASTRAGGGGDASSSGRGQPGGKSLLRLAARDATWRNGIIRSLVEAEAGRAKTESEADLGGSSGAAGGRADQHKGRQAPPLDGVLPADPSAVGGDKNGGLESQLQSLFFGTQVSRIIKNRNKPLALPPRDVTAVLFDLATRIAMTTSAATDFSGGGGKTTLSPRLSREVALATRFVLADALPAMMRTFKPLTWQQRRVLWPLYQPGGSEPGDSYAGGDMTLSIASNSTGWGTPTQRKNLKEQIEDMELDVETRAETCYLVTFYFTRQLLPQLAARGGDGDDTSTPWYDRSQPTNPEETEVVEFVKSYGAYLKLHTCLTCAADAHSGAVLLTLLDVAKFDMRHRECLKVLSKQNTFLLYEPAMLSAILVRMQRFADDDNTEEQVDMLPLFVRAYPDLRPWIVREAFTLRKEENDDVKNDDTVEFNDLYYRYLSLLLAPEDGNDSARRDGKLVEEWCTMSTSQHANASADVDGFFKNFRAVASKSSKDWSSYHRDIPMLMDLSMSIGDYDLALDLAGEIIAHTSYSRDCDVLAKVLPHLRAIGMSQIRENTHTERHASNTLRRIIQLFTMMAVSKSDISRDAVSVPDELNSFLQACDALPINKNVAPNRVTEKEKAFISLVAETAAPSDVLMTFSQWSKGNVASAVVMPALRSSLAYGARAGMQKELSGALLRIRQARGGGQRDKTADGLARSSGVTDGMIWQRLGRGDASIEK